MLSSGISDKACPNRKHSVEGSFKQNGPAIACGSVAQKLNAARADRPERLHGVDRSSILTYTPRRGRANNVSDRQGAPDISSLSEGGEEDKRGKGRKKKEERGRELGVGSWELGGRGRG
eukprot:2380075-Rhodomonas_salina.1